MAVQHLVETDWLAEHLADPHLRILDCSIVYQAGRYEMDYNGWAQGHIPRSALADLVNDLSDATSPFLFMMPPPVQFVEAMSRYGVGEGTQVVLYDRSINIWAARVWWILRAMGFDDAAVLNGGWRKWTLEERPISTDPPAYPPANFVASPRPQLMVDKNEVLAVIGDGRTCLLNALPAEEHIGAVTRYQRPGRIPASINVPAASIVDPLTHAYLPMEQLRARFAGAGVLSRERVITYCGGGITASSDAFILTLLGVENVAVYDGSLSEWTADDALPMEVG